MRAYGRWECAACHAVYTGWAFRPVPLLWQHRRLDPVRLWSDCLQSPPVIAMSKLGKTQVRLTMRDEQVLRACARFRAIRTRDLHRLLFDTRRDTMLHRLARLRTAGLLTATRQSSTEELVWHLGSAGRAWVRGRGIEAGRCPRASALGHHLALVGVWTSLAVGCHDRPDVRLISCQPDWEYRVRSGTAATLVVPDLFARIETPAGIHTLAVEIDRRASEPLSVIRGKVERYRVVLCQPAGLLDAARLTLLFVLVESGPGRTRAIEGILDEQWFGSSAVGSEGPNVVETVLAAFARYSPDDLPRRLGRSEPITADAITAPPLSDGGL